MSCRGAQGSRALMSPSSPSSLPRAQPRMETHKYLPHQLPQSFQPPRMEIQGAEMAHRSRGMDGVEPGWPWGHWSCVHPQRFVFFMVLKGCAFGMTVNEEITYSPV